MKIKFTHTYQDIISVENLLESWREFTKGKKSRTDVQIFSSRLMDNILELHNDLSDFNYQHGLYQSFRINDPKLRKIHKSSVRDRLLHHVVHRILYPFFDKTFASDSFSCRNKKGTHRALNRSREFGYIVSRNKTQTCWILKCDIRKFFENIDHDILLAILKKHITDKNIAGLLEKIIRSFSSAPGRGLPLGNLTSQLFVNIYMNKFDQFVKHKLKIRYYIRYADDIIFLSHNRQWLTNILIEINSFLRERLKLQLHPKKISIRTVASGVDFLGWVNFSYQAILRTKTRKRMLNRIKENPAQESLASYLGLLRDCRRMPIRPKLPNFGKFLSKIFSPILLYCLKNFIKNFLEIVKIYARKSIRRQSLKSMATLLSFSRNLEIIIGFGKMKLVIELKNELKNLLFRQF